MSIIAAIQMASGGNVQANLMEAERLIREAAYQKAKLVVLPETFALMGEQDADQVAIAEEFGSGAIQKTISRLAQQLNIWIVAGTIPIKSDRPDRAWARSIVYDDQGEVAGFYDKIHLFNVTVGAEGKADDVYAESDAFTAGNQAVVIDTPVGRLGLSVCYDVRFPELYRELVEQGAQILTVPAAFTAVTGSAHWKVLLRARAVENLCYVVGAAQGGFHVNGRETYGNSMIVDHWGQVIDKKKRGSGVVLATVDLEAQASTRQRFPVLSHRRLG